MQKKQAERQKIVRLVMLLTSEHEYIYKHYKILCNKLIIAKKEKYMRQIEYSNVLCLKKSR